MSRRKRFDPVVLFERPRVPRLPVKYLGFEKELEAVARGEKALSAMSYLREHIESTEFLELLDHALRHGLALVLSPDGPAPRRKADQLIRVYLLPEREMWRVPATTALLDNAYAYGGWSDSLEAQNSALWGYSKADIEKWIAWRRWNQAGWGCTTVYALLDTDQRARAEELALRMFGPASSLEDIEFLLHRHGAALSPTAAKRVPRGWTLARVGIDHELVKQLFGRDKFRPEHSVATATVTPAIARRFAKAMRTNVQLLGPDGWSS